MSKKAMMISAAVIALTAGSSALASNAVGTLITIVPVTTSTSTNVFGITDTINGSNIITGSWLDSSGVEHGYVGPLSGTNYTTFDDPNEPGPGTEPRAINDNQYITGFSNSQNGSTENDVPFERTPDGTITEVTMDGTLLNYVAQGLNSNNAFAASYIDTATLAVIGYTGKNAAYKSTWSMSALSNTGYAGRGVNNSHDIVGWYYNASGIQHGLLVTGGVAQQLDPPATNLASNVLEGINDKHMITGQYTDTSGIIHGYMYDRKSGKFFYIKVPGAVSFVQAWGINNDNLVALGSDAGYYVFCPAHATCPSAAKRHGSYKPAVKPKPMLP
jgi:hypothetical protein